MALAVKDSGVQPHPELTDNTPRATRAGGTPALGNTDPETSLHPAANPNHSPRPHCLQVAPQSVPGLLRHSHERGYSPLLLRAVATERLREQHLCTAAVQTAGIQQRLPGLIQKAIPDSGMSCDCKLCMDSTRIPFPGRFGISRLIFLTRGSSNISSIHAFISNNS